MSTFGTLFRVTTYGESHGLSVGCIIDGVPSGLMLSEDDIQPQLSRRRPGQNVLLTQRQETDCVQIQSGVENGITLGTPIALFVRNWDIRPCDYNVIQMYPRPGHADLTYLQKYGRSSHSGGGRSSARETIGRVAAGAIAEKYLFQTYGIEIVAFVSSIGQIHMQWDKLNVESSMKQCRQFDNEDEDGLVSLEFLSFLSQVTRQQVDTSIVRCPDAVTSEKMIARIERAKRNQDSVGGTITCVIRNLPAGLGEPCFDKLEAKLAHAMLSIPSTKGFEIGSGFKGTETLGSKHNDSYVLHCEETPLLQTTPRMRLRTTTNNSGGVQGGISNGEHIFFKVAFKPPSSIGKPQLTANYDGIEGILVIEGRHDPNVTPRAVPIVESMAALVIMDALMIQLSRQTAQNLLSSINIERQ
ncbi:hypothetical protein PCANB_002309 [Pneumocystis canis]|nr:hypothetical protein PCK1_002268 [Pneumocystis canis]KAG5438979.1 hypothetical protein PCANB_002309 [Pneumocystis canis]